VESAAKTLFEVSGVAGVGVLLAVLGLSALRRRSESGLGLFLGAWAFAPFVLAFLVSFLKPIYLDRYLITAAPAFAVLAAIAIFALGSRWGRFAGAAIVATAVGLAHGYTRGAAGWRGEGWRDAVATAATARRGVGGGRRAVVGRAGGDVLRCVRHQHVHGRLDLGSSIGRSRARAPSVGASTARFGDHRLVEQSSTSAGA
jgi:hypothetical protein